MEQYKSRILQPPYEPIQVSLPVENTVVKVFQVAYSLQWYIEWWVGECIYKNDNKAFLFVATVF